MIEKQKKRKYGNQRHFYIYLHLKDRLHMEFVACYSELMPERALTLFTVCDAYRYFVGQTLLLTSQIDHTENI